MHDEMKQHYLLTVDRYHNEFTDEVRLRLTLRAVAYVASVDRSVVSEQLCTDTAILGSTLYSSRMPPKELLARQAARETWKLAEEVFLLDDVYGPPDGCAAAVVDVSTLPYHQCRVAGCDNRARYAADSLAVVPRRCGIHDIEFNEGKGVLCGRR